MFFFDEKNRCINPNCLRRIYNLKVSKETVLFILTPKKNLGHQQHKKNRILGVYSTRCREHDRFRNLYVACRTRRFRGDKYRGMDLRVFGCRFIGRRFRVSGQACPQCQWWTLCLHEVGHGRLLCVFGGVGLLGFNLVRKRCDYCGGSGLSGCVFPCLGRICSSGYRYRVGDYLVLYMD